MADEVKRIIEIEARYQTLAQLQQAIDKDKEALEGLTKGSYAYAKTQAELKAIQQEFNQEMRIAVKSTTSAKNSYNDLVNQLAILKEAWKKADPNSDAFKEYTRQVNEVKAQLEGMDHEIGNWQRNVGNYGNSIAGIAPLFGNMGTAIAGATQKVNLFRKALDFLKAHPVFLVLGGLAAVISGIAKAFKQSEEASMRLAEALAPLKAGSDLVKNAFEGLAKAVASAAQWLGDAAEKLGLFSDEMKKRQLLQKMQNELTLQERDILVENELLRAKAAEARRQAADKANLTEQQRIDLLRQAESYLTQAAKNEQYLAEKRLSIAIREKNMAPNDPEANRKLAEAQAEVYRVQGNLSQQTTRITSQISAAQKEEQAGIEKTAKTYERALQKIKDDYKDFLNERKFNAKQLADIDKEYVATQESVGKEVDAFASSTDIFESARLEFQIRRDALQEGSAEYLQAEVDLKKFELDTLHQVEGESEDEFRDRQLQKEQEYNKARQALSQKRINDTMKVATAISSLIDEVAGAYQNEIKAKVEAGKISEAEGEKEFENVKALQYATTWINTLTAMVGALADPTPLPWVVKAANAATALTAGIANTVKIANTTLGNTQTSSAVGAGVQSVQTVAPAVQVAVPEYRTLTSASDEQTLNERASSQKVVLVTSELEAFQQGRQVTLAESTF